MLTDRTFQLGACATRIALSTFGQLSCFRYFRALALVAIAVLAGCGATKSYIATEQLLLSDAIDSTVDQLDFTPLAGRKVFLDTTFVTPVRSTAGQGLVSSEYIVSSVREQMLLSGCHLCPEKDKADVIAELRVGAMGTDGHSVVLGIPASHQLSSVPIGGNSVLPSLPEISFAKRDTMSGGAKVAVFAYARETREAVWQSGVAHSTSSATDTWVMGVGPQQRGSIHEHATKDEKPQKASAAQTSSVVADQAKHRTPPLISASARSDANAKTR